MNACLLNISNFLVTAYTSPVTLQVLGNVKNCLSIPTSVCIFGNPLEVEQIIGVLTCLFGVWLYNRATSSSAASEKSKKSTEMMAPDERGPESAKTTSPLTREKDPSSV